jgi:hypothetical protein
MSFAKSAKATPALLCALAAALGIMTSNVTTISKSTRIAGTWKHCDGFTDVEFTFSVANGTVSVSIIDTSDGEKPDIYDVQWSEANLVLCFAAHWSTGRLLKYRVAVGPNADRLQATITSTHQELWERQ